MHAEHTCSYVLCLVLFQPIILIARVRASVYAFCSGILNVSGMSNRNVFLVCDTTEKDRAINTDAYGPRSMDFKDFKLKISIK